MLQLPEVDFNLDDIQALFFENNQFCPIFIVSLTTFGLMKSNFA